MQSEYDFLVASKTWELVKFPDGRRPITARWIFKVKQKADGTIDRYKARLVVRGFSQKPGIDYTETFSPVVRPESVRVILTLAAQSNLGLTSSDAKTAYLHGTIERDLYLMQPSS